MQERPRLWGRLIARAHGEVPASTVEAYQRAGGAAYDLLEQTEQRRRELKGQEPWTFDPATQIWLLCAWNAFVLQALGDQFVQADYQLSPATAGYLLPVTVEQVLAFYSQVEGWIGRARQAQTNAAYRLDVHVPADLPPWSMAEPCPRSHLEGMLAALRLLRVHAEAAMLSFESAAADRQAAVQQLRQQATDAGTRAEYAEQLWSRDVPQNLHEQIEGHAKSAIEIYYRLGQLLAMPQLLDAPQRPSTGNVFPAVLSGKALSLPGEPGFDPWVLTDPRSRAQWKQDPAGRKAVTALWANDPDPRRTLAIQAEIDAALSRGDIAYASDGGGVHLGCYFCCPWSAIYSVRRPLTIGGQPLRSLQQFTYDVSAEGVRQGEPFRREILVTHFQATSQVDYCDPSEEREDR